MMLTRLFALFVLILTLTTYSCAQISSGDGDGSGESPTTPSPAESTTTTSPAECSELCDTDQKCATDCPCIQDSDHLSLDDYCSEPCNNKFVWCTGGSNCVLAGGEKGYKCDCNAGYFRGQADTCEKGKYFGGEITFTDVYNSSNFDETASEIQDILDTIYNTTLYYMGSTVLDIVDGSTIATYQLLYQDQADVTEQTVQNSFKNFSGCDGNDIATMSDYTINCTASNGTVVVPDILCSANLNSTLSSGCDSDTAICNTDDGNFFCSCIENYAKASADSTSCLEIKCMDDSECGPFGGICNYTDDTDQLNNMCDCFFGFAGDQCQEPWEFVFTVVTAGLGLILIGVVTACICQSSTSKTSAKSTKQEDLDLQNPFVDFQPGIVRAKVPSNMYSVSDSYEATNGGQSHTNGAYDGAYDELNTGKTSTFSGEQRQSEKHNYEYF